MLSDQLWEVEKQLEEAREHYSRGVFEDTYHPDVWDEFDDIVLRIKRLRMRDGLDTPPGTGEIAESN